MRSNFAGLSKTEVEQDAAKVNSTTAQQVAKAG
jgi:hypothetical protein